jgi:hypothetical protein
MTPAQPVEPQPQQMEPEVPVEPAPIVEIARPVERAVTLTRPKWVPKPQPERVVATPVVVPIAPPQAIPPVDNEEEGFTLRFESDAALMRLVATSHVGLYALEQDRAQRMTVSESRISFWAASTPNTFHEMETSTVPGAVIEALTRTGTKAGTASWGVTLPGKLKTQLDDLMREHSGGSLIIGASGDIRWEAS